MEIKRTFYAIGHGGFFVEQIGNYTMVFDCGSSNKNTINNAVERAFPILDTKIDAVFISHFHMDHINGLNKLIKEHHIEKLYIPFLSRIERLFLVLNIDNKRDLFEQKFILEPEIATKEISKNSIQIIYVLPEEEGNTYRFTEPTQKLISGSDINLLSFWKYLPVCQQVIPSATRTTATELFLKKETLGSLNNYLIEEGEQNINGLITDIINIRASKDTLKRIKKQVKITDENKYCMMLYSGPSKNFLNNFGHQSTSYRIATTLPFGCLYFADYNITSETEYNFYQKHYSQYFPNIGIILMPHHGSEKSFNDKIINKWQICIIAAAEKDKNKHPDLIPLKQTLNKRGILLQLGTQEDIRENILIDENNLNLIEHFIY